MLTFIAVFMSDRLFALIMMRQACCTFNLYIETGFSKCLYPPLPKWRGHVVF